MNKYIGFDIGGVKIGAGLVQGGKILKRKIVKTPKNKKEFLAAVFGIIREFFNQKNKIAGIGIGMKGVINRTNGKIIKVPGLSKLNGLNLKKAVENKFKIPVRVDNDAKCFLQAEEKFGAAKNFKNAVGLILGTGIGAGIMIDGKIYYGRDGTAGEVGHTIINSKFKIQNSKLIFSEILSFEDLAAKKGFLRLGVKDTEKLAEGARRGGKKAIKIFEIVGGNLGIGLANIINTLNPEIIVLGGGLSNVARFLIPPARKMIKKLVLSPGAKSTPIIVSKLGDEAGILGAVLLFFE